MMNFSKTTLLTILLIIFIILAGFFAFQWWQVKGELGRQVEENKNLMNQINELKAIEEKTEGEVVTITTDKTEYEQGEVVEITVRNALDKSIWYIKEICSPSCCDLYKFENDEWRFLTNPFPCVVFTYPGGITRPDELKPGEEIKKQLDTKDRDEFIKGGKYRFSFSYGLTQDFYNEKTVYSNEFTIK